ncbi:MAG TPA: VOC family protein [Vicinamibacterales bacterium]|nr:VOC family protein [Vicinamibacterales bacterium]
MNHSNPSDRAYGVRPPSFVLPEGTHVGAVHLQVTDLQTSMAYYQQVIGLQSYESTPDTAVLGPHGEQHAILHLETRRGLAPARQGALGLYHFAILVPDRPALGRFAVHLTGLGARVGMADHFVSESFYLWDPDGLGIEVYADKPRTGWRHEGRELVMTTETMDVRSVVASAGERRWDGAPAGTRMGHVHLHVGALDEAERFYHAALGLEKMVWNYPGALFLAASGYHHHLGTNVWSDEPPARENEARLLEWELVVPRVEVAAAAARSVAAAGYAVEERAGRTTFADPWGTRVRIVSGVKI